MAIKFKSVARAIKRGHLRVNTKQVFTGNWISDPITGIMSQEFAATPFLERKTKTNRLNHPKGTWIPYGV